MSTLPKTPFITINGGSQQTVPLISSNGDLLNNAYVAVFTNTNGNYNFAGNSYTGYFKFQGMETAENAVYIIAVGGGGAGGNETGVENQGPGCGGGGGGTSLFWFNQLDPAYTYAVSVGVGGQPGGNGVNGGNGGNTIIDVYDVSKNGTYNFQYNLMTAEGGGGGAGNNNIGNVHGPGGPGGASTGIPNWGSYPYNPNPNYDDIGIGDGGTGGSGGGAYNSSAGNSTFPQLTTITNNLATTYEQSLPWISTLIDNIGPLQNWYGGGGGGGGYMTVDYTFDFGSYNITGTTNKNSYGGKQGYGAYYNSGVGYGNGSNGYSYGDGGGGGYVYLQQITTYYDVYEGNGEYIPEESTADTFESTTGGAGYQGCVIVVMIPGYSSIACNPNSTVSNMTPVPPPPPPRPPEPPINAQTISAPSLNDMDCVSTDCCEVSVSVKSAFENYTFEELINYIEKNKVVEDFLQNHSFNSLDEVKNVLSSNQRYYFLQMLYNKFQYEQYIKYIVPQLRVNKTCCTFFKNIPGTNCNYRCLVVTGTENTVRFICKEDISLNIICVGGGGGGGGSYANYSASSLAYYGGGGAGGNTCIAKNIAVQQDTLYEINVGGGGGYNKGGGGGIYYISGTSGIGSSGGSTQVYSPQGGILLQASGGGGGYGNGNGGVCGDESSSGIYNIIGGSGGNGINYYSLTNNVISYSTNGQSITPSEGISSYLSSYQDILNYFDVSSNNFSIIINSVTCKNIIKNKYGGGGGGGGYYGGNPDLLFYYPGFPGKNGTGGTISTPYVYTKTPSAGTIGSGGGGGTVLNGEDVGNGGQGLVIIYWEISKSNQEEAENRIKEYVDNTIKSLENDYNDYGSDDIVSKLLEDEIKLYDDETN